MEFADTVIDARWVIPVDASNSTLDHHSIVIVADKIQRILPTVEADKLFSATNHVRLSNHAVIPGFVNAHTHAAMTLFRGAAEDASLDTWLQQCIWPLEGQWVDAEFVRDGTTLAIAELIRSGTTCLNDMYLFPEVVGEVAEQTHMRTTLGMIALEFPTKWANSAEEYLSKGMELHARFKDSELVTTMFAPHAPHTVSDDTLEKIVGLDAEHRLGVHIHVHETTQEIEDSIKMHGVRPIERLQKLGMLNSRLIAVHVTQLLDEEISLLAESNSNIAHCPKSNLKLACGISPVSDLLKHNVNVAIGTDGAASNNSLNMLEEMRFAALLAKGKSADASNVSVHEALRMSTINGAKSLGLGPATGSLEPGKLADITAIDLSSIYCSPIYDPVSQIVHAASRDQVTDVWIGGKQVLDNQVLTCIDEAQCLEIANRWHAKISNTLSSC